MAVLRAGYKRGGVSALRGIPGLCPGPRSGIPTGPGAPVPRAAGSVLCPVRGRPCTLNAASVRRSVLKGTLRPAGDLCPGWGSLPGTGRTRLRRWLLAARGARLREPGVLPRPPCRREGGDPEGHWWHPGPPQGGLTMLWWGGHAVSLGRDGGVQCLWSWAGQGVRPLALLPLRCWHPAWAELPRVSQCP